MFEFNWPIVLQFNLELDFILPAKQTFFKNNGELGLPKNGAQTWFQISRFNSNLERLWNSLFTIKYLKLLTELKERVRHQVIQLNAAC